MNGKNERQGADSGKSRKYYYVIMTNMLIKIRENENMNLHNRLPHTSR